MAGFRIDDKRNKVSDIKKNIETKKGELEQLENHKQELLDAGTDMQGSEIDEDVQATLMELINGALEDNAEKGRELSNEMNSDLDSLEDMKQETQESVKSNESQRKSLESKKALLDKFGIGGKLEGAISELDTNMGQLEDLNDSLIETEKELSDVSAKLGML